MTSETPELDTAPEELLRLTSSYVAAEDRIRLSALSSTRKEMVFWMTRRLLRLLVLHLCGLLEQDSGSVGELVEGQGNARQALVPQPPIVAASPDEECLLGAVDITFQEPIVRLGFKTAATAPVKAVMAFNIMDLRQWLQILYGQTVLAEWSLSEWPQWLVAGGARQPVVPHLH